jgi:hypothetical protein
MSLVTTTPAAESSVLIVTVIVVVMAACAFLGWASWRACQDADRAERDPRFRHRLLIRGALLYAFCAILGIEKVVTGEAPVQYLFGLIVPAALIWFFIRAASRVKVPPA